MRFLRSLLTQRFIVYVVLCLFGLAALVGLFIFGPPTYIVPDAIHAQSNNVVGQTAWHDVLLIQKSSLLTLLLIPMATIMITVSLFEIIKYAAEFAVGYWTGQHRFDEFFGDKASSNGKNGVSFLEPTDIPTLLELISPGISTNMDRPEKNRFFKARQWVNRWDTEGAKAIREMFQERGYDPPELSHSLQDVDVTTPFAFSMGLGFTEETGRVVQEACDPWLRISKSGSGDWIELRHQLLPDSVTLFKGTERSKGKEFREVIPDAWDQTKWVAHPEQVRDYAIILRHTRKHTTAGRFFLCSEGLLNMVPRLLGSILLNIGPAYGKTT